MNILRKFNGALSPASLARGALLLLIFLNLEALGEQAVRSSQAWNWHRLIPPLLYGLQTAVWLILLGLSFSPRGKTLLERAPRLLNCFAACKGWYWAAILVMAALYLLSRLSPAAALIQRFIPHPWMWGHMVLISAVFLWAALPGKPISRLIICMLAGAILWYATAPGSTFQQIVQAKLNPPQPSMVIAFLGGSITAGDGASDPEQTSWRALTTTWLQAQYPERQIVSINASLAGTGSDLGVFRCQKEVLQHEPDLVFIEFAVNDSALAEDISSQAIEGIVRMLRINKPATHIFFVYATTQEMACAYEKGGTPLSVQWQERIASYYQIPTIHAGQSLWQAIASGRTDWEDLTVDGVHPTDRGYQIYFEEVRAALQAARIDIEYPFQVLPPPLILPSLENARIVPADQLSAPGWELTEKLFPPPFWRAVQSDQAGITFTYSFTGRVAGVYWRLAPDAGQIAWAVDNMAEQTADSWSASSRNAHVIFTRDLAPGAHSLRLRILPSQNPASSGKWIRILGLLQDQ